MSLDELNRRLGVEVNPDLLQLALTHSSFAYENGKQPDNERLEFLGDSVLGFVVSSHIHQIFADFNEKELSRVRQALVSASALEVAADQIGLDEFIRLGVGAQKDFKTQRKSVLADTFEAVLAAAYLTGGVELATQIIAKYIYPLIDSVDQILAAHDPKTTLLMRLDSLSMVQAKYEVTAVGDQHERIYVAKVYSGEKLLGEGQARNTKSAETEAAIAALKALPASNS
jgi:ribonuclease-3